MNEHAVEHHISVTRTSSDGLVEQAEVHIVGDCFDPSTCCDAREQAMIAALRAYLRPETAPECLMARLRATLDQCCGDDR